MASRLARAKLARVAGRLNARYGTTLPSLILLTDDMRVADPIAAARGLPQGSAVILRHRDSAERARLAAALTLVARENGLLISIAGDARLALEMAADGIHFAEKDAALAAHCRVLNPELFITLAAHSERALLAAARAGANAALLAPLFSTKSHPGKNGIGIMRTRLTVARAPLPVYALGGVTSETANRLRESKFAGIAAIEGLLAG